MTIDANFPRFIWRARVAAKLSDADPSRPLDAILYSAIALEAFPNDFADLIEVFSEHKPNDFAVELLAVGRILPELEKQRVQPRTKYQILYHLLTTSTFDPSKPPYQDFEFLLNIRNELVHPKCNLVRNEGEKGLVRYDQKTRKLISGMIGRGFLLHPNDPCMPWKMYLDNKKAADWAVETACLMINAILDAVPECPFKNHIEHWRSPHSSMRKAV